MDRPTFFKKLHEDLADKYGLMPDQVRYIRVNYFQDRSRKDILFHNIKSLKRKARKEFRQKIVDFLASCSNEAWLDITQITDWDKKK